MADGDGGLLLCCGVTLPSSWACGQRLTGPHRHDDQGYTSWDCPAHGELFIQSDVGELDLGVVRERVDQDAQAAFAAAFRPGDRRVPAVDHRCRSLPPYLVYAGTVAWLSGCVLAGLRIGEHVASAILRRRTGG